MIEELSFRELRALKAMAACAYGFELRENLGPAGVQTLETLTSRGWAVVGTCPVRPESIGWAITEAGKQVLDACSAREQMGHFQRTNTLTSEQCRAARDLLEWTAVDLAIKARCSSSTVERLENPNYSASPRTRNAIRSALEAAGVEFTNGEAPGVRLRSKAE